MNLMLISLILKVYIYIEKIANSWQGSSRVINSTANWGRMTNKINDINYL
jgi:hypothetical protein